MKINRLGNKVGGDFTEKNRIVRAFQFNETKAVRKQKFLPNGVVVIWLIALLVLIIGVYKALVL